MNNRFNQSTILLWGLTLLAIVAYSLPWIKSSGSSLTFNAYDLAEWVSLHPDSRVSSLALMVTLALRLQLVCIVMIIAVSTHRPILTLGWWLSAFFILMITVALLPPFEFFSITWNDMNYQQQLGLTLVTLFGGILGLSGRLDNIQRPITIFILIVALITCMVGLYGALRQMSEFNLSYDIGLGGMSMIVLYAAIGFAQVHEMTKPGSLQ